MNGLAARQQRVFEWALALLEEQPLLAEKVIDRCGGVQRDNVLEAVNEMLRFLWLCNAHPQVLTPSERVDQIWHEFILFTRAYQHFCQAHFGRYIHHQPSDQPAAEELQYRATLACYETDFGPPAAQYWPQPGNQPVPCGACESD